MKKILFLLIGLFCTFGLSEAQNIYVAGHSTTDTLGQRTAFVFKNGQALYSWQNDTHNPIVKSLNITDEGDIFWSGYVTDTNGISYGYAWKNEEVVHIGEAGTAFNSTVPFREHLWLGGHKPNDVGQMNACVWLDGESAYTPGDGNNPTSINKVILHIDEYGAYNLFEVGNETVGDSLSKGHIWSGNDAVLDLGDSLSTYIFDALYENNFYSAGYTIIDSIPHATVWLDASISMLNDSINSMATCISKFGDDLYFGGYADTLLVVWKNDEVLYSIPMSGQCALTCLYINEDGVYFAGQYEGHGMVWKDGEVLYELEELETVSGLAVMPLCNGLTRTLPWTESFEEGETDWECFTISDFDGNADITWELSDSLSLDGIFSARHLACDNIQEGWLITPPLYLQPNRDTTWMQFTTYEAHPENFTYSGVWASTSGTETSDFTEIWSQENPSAAWDTITLDLSAYQGEKLYLAFKYSGHHGHDWYIDQINIEEYYTPRDTIFAQYYGENFENGLGNWYILDLDHNGNLQNWRIENQGHDSEHSAYHPAIGDNLYDDCWMISRPIHLDADHFYDLSFFHKDDALSGLGLGSLQIAIDVNGAPTPDDFTQIWPNSHHCEEWTEETINMNEYAGHDVYLAFRDKGFGTAWYVDDIDLVGRIAEYTITVSSDHPGWGYVTGGGTYQIHDTIQIEATAYMGFEFYGWSDGNADNPRTIIVDHDMDIQGMFRVQQCLIKTQVTPEGTGTVEGGGTYDYGSTIQLMARANQGCYFITWTDGVIGNPRPVFVEGNATYTAEFGRNEYQVTTAANPENGGTVEGAGTYYYGDTAVLVATPHADYMFLCWSDGIVSNPRYAKVTNNATYTALFHMTGTPNYTITVEPNDPMLGTTTGSGLYPEGSVIQISARPFSGCRFTGWNDGNTDNPRDITVTQDIAYIAYFETCPTYAITVESGDPTMGTVYGSGTYAEGSTAVIGAEALEGFHFVGWQDGDMNNPRYINVVEDATYIASFSETPIATYTVTVYYDENQGFVIGAGTYAEGATASLAAIAADGYTFVKWSDETTNNPKEFIVDRDIILAAFFNTTGVDDLDLAHFSLFPNPVTNTLHIEGIDDDTKVCIYNAYGSLVKTAQICGDSEIGISELSAGLYLFKVGNRCVRFVKQ